MAEHVDPPPATDELTTLRAFLDDRTVNAVRPEGRTRHGTTVVIAEAICADGCEGLVLLLIVGTIVAFTLWIWTSAMMGVAVMLTVRRRRPRLRSLWLAAIAVAATAATAIATAGVATGLDLGMSALLIPLGGVVWFVVEVRRATSGGPANRPR